MMPGRNRIHFKASLSCQHFCVSALATKDHPVQRLYILTTFLCVHVHACRYGSCDGLLVDGRASTNSAGRPFKATWTLVDFVPAEVGSSAEYVAETLSKVKDVLLDMPMPFIQCPPGSPPGQVCYMEDRFPFGSYTLNVVLTNWVGAYASAEIKLNKTRYDVPSLVVGGERTLNLPRHQELIIMADARPSMCGPASDTPLFFTWSLSPDPNGGPIQLPRGRTLLLPPHTLTIGVVYTVTISVAQGTQPQGGVRPSLSVNVNVIPSKPVAVISGGDRLVSLYDKNAFFTLDASRSFSPDYGIKIRGSVTVLWSCAQNKKINGMDLGYALFPCSTIAAEADVRGFDRRLTFNISARKLYRHAQTFTGAFDGYATFTEGCDEAAQIPQEVPMRCDPTALYQFTVHVCDIAHGTGYNCSSLGSSSSSSASVIWSTTPVKSVPVGIAPLDESRFLRVRQLNLVGVMARGDGRQQARYSWTQIEPVGFNIMHSGNLLVQSTFLRNLVLKPGVLQGSDPYTFRLFATYNEAEDMTNPLTCTSCGWAQITVYQNLPPSSGTLTVIPTEGIALDTPFRLTATQWVDPPLPQDDYPLTYTFGYYDDQGDAKYLKVNSLQSTNTMVLPQGTQRSSPTDSCTTNKTAPTYSAYCSYLRLMLDVSDSLGAAASLGEQVRSRMS